MATDPKASDKPKTSDKIDVDSARGFLEASTFLGSLPTAALDQLLKRGHVVRYKKGAAIYQRGDAGDSMLVILSGRVKIYNTTVDAREVVLNFLTAGDVNGEIAVLDGRERTATAEASEQTDALVLYRRDVVPVLTAHPDALLEIVHVLCDKLRATSEIVEDSQRSMKGRMARGLLRLARQHGKRTKDGIRIDLAVNQRDLGNYLSLSRENTSRQLASLAEAGLIESISGAIIIRDEVALTAIADSETV